MDILPENLSRGRFSRHNESWKMNVSDGKTSHDKPLETHANILEAIY